MDNLTFKEGGMWENYPWEIHFEYKCSEVGGGKPCKHCYNVHDEKHHKAEWFKNDKDYCYTNKEWICPRVVIALNEGGCNSTGVCLDCILEAAKILDNKPKRKEKL